MIKQDDRTIDQRASHRYGVVARDNLMSGWGAAADGYSRCAWAVPDSMVHDGRIDRVARWVRARVEMRHVSVVDLNAYRPPRGTAHFHIYVVDEGHPALR